MASNAKQEEMELELLKMKKFLKQEKKLRDKRRRQELRRSQRLMDNILQFSILMNSDASNMLRGILPYANMPGLDGFSSSINNFMDFKNMGEVGRIAQTSGNLYLDPKMQAAALQQGQPQGQQGQNLFALGRGPYGANQGGGGGDEQQQGPTLSEIAEKKARKKARKARRKKREKIRRERLRREQEEAAREREKKDYENALDIMNKRADRDADIAHQQLVDERERKRLEEEERLRQERLRKEREEQERLKRELRYEQIWIHYIGICYYYISPLIFFEIIKQKVLRQRSPSYLRQAKNFKKVRPKMVETLRKSMAKWLQGFAKNKDKYNITDNQDIIADYSGSVPRLDQIQKRLDTYILVQLKSMIDIVLKQCDDKGFTKEVMVMLAECYDDRIFPVKNIYWEMEVIRLDFDSFGRLK